jgi:outer membrane protein assembly factor BamA
VAYVGVEGAAVPGLLNNLPLRPGDRWSTLALDATRDTLVRRMRNRGYPYSDVLRQTIFPVGEPYHAHVTFEVEPGIRARYGDIQVLGNAHLSESTVLKTLPFRRGDPFRADQLIEGQGRLFGLEMVTSATVTPDLSSPGDSVVRLLVQVVEGDPYRVRAGIGGSTAECANVEARWTSRNFMGGGRVLQVRGRLSNVLTHQFRELLCPQGGEEEYGDLTWLGAVDFSQPWIFSTRNSFIASVFAERQTLPPDVFIRSAIGFQASLTRTLALGTTVTAFWRPEYSKLDAGDVRLCTGFLVCDPEDVALLESSNWLAPLGLAYTRDRSDDLLNPRNGSRILVEL